VFGVYRKLFNQNKDSFTKMVLYFFLLGLIRGLKNTYYIIIKVHFVGFQNYLIIQGAAVMATMLFIYILKNYEKGKKMTHSVKIHESIILLADIILLLAFFFTSYAPLIVLVS
jgi:hypothetical protein